jgi:DNA-binding response OmpR family regulator
MTAPHILIVEGEVDLATTCARFLLRIGYYPRLVKSGIEALAAVAQRAPDAAIVDLRLPGALDGLAVARQLRRRSRPIAVVLCAARVSEESRREAAAAGAEYLPKPFSLAELRHAVDRALGHHPAAEGSVP